MHFQIGNKSVLKFGLKFRPSDDLTSSPLSLLAALNSKPWMGKEEKSCLVIDFNITRTAPDEVELIVLVGYRPPGWISEETADGRRRLNGWSWEFRSQSEDGAPLDPETGYPLPWDAEPVFQNSAAFLSKLSSMLGVNLELDSEVFRTADFNNCNFGRFLGEL
jgi:hypothetical protein